MKIKSNNGKFWDTNEMTLAELEALYEDVIEGKLSIQAKMEHNKIERAQGGVGMEPHEYAQTKIALRYKKNQEDFLRKKIASEKQKLKPGAPPQLSDEVRLAKIQSRSKLSESINSHFVDVVREFADEKTFNACLAEAKRRAKQAFLGAA